MFLSVLSYFELYFVAGVAQCIREGQAIGLIGGNDNITEMSEGCRIHGHLEVNKVAGNFHIAPGQSFQQSHVHIHSLRNIRLNMLNTTHMINHLSFGQYFPNQINPLSDTQQLTADTGVLFHYYIKVVPSTYVFLNKTEVRTNQYSVTKHQKAIRNIADANNHQLPGVFFTYEISAIMVKFIERDRSFAQFITSSCAIIVRTRNFSIGNNHSIFYFRVEFLQYQVLLMHFYIVVVVLFERKWK